MNNPCVWEAWPRKAADDREGVYQGQGADGMGDWAGFFEAELGAAAALAGLVIVAISINIARILADPTLPGRAGETLVAPTGVLVVASFALVPGQPAAFLGAETLLSGVAMGLIPGLIILAALRRGKGMDVAYVVRRAVL